MYLREWILFVYQKLLLIDMQQAITTTENE